MMDDLSGGSNISLALAAMTDAYVEYVCRATKLESRLAATLRVAERAIMYNDRINHHRQTHAAVKSSTPRTEVNNACTTRTTYR